MTVEDFPVSRDNGVISLVDRLWYLLAGPRLTVILLVWITVMVLLGIVVPTAPQSLDDPLIRSQWLSAFPQETWPTVESLERLGIFDLYSSIWLRIPLVLLLVHALVVLANWGPCLWRRAVLAPDVISWDDSVVPRPGHVAKRNIDLDQESEEDEWQGLGDQLETQGYGVKFEEGGKRFLAWSRRWVWLALLGVYLGLGIAALGLILDGWLGGTTELSLEPSRPVPVSVSASAGPNLVLDQVLFSPGSPIDLSSGQATVQVVTAEPGSGVQIGDGESFSAGVNERHLVHGMWLTVLEIRPVVKITANDVETEESVQLQPFVPGASPSEQVRLPLWGESDARFTGVPSRNVTLRVDQIQSDLNRASNPDFSVEFFRGIEAEAVETVTMQSDSETIFDGVRYRVLLDHDARVRIRPGPWWALIFAGLIVTLFSLGLMIVLPPMLIHGQLRSRGTSALNALTVEIESVGRNSGPVRHLMKVLCAAAGVNETPSA